MVILECGNVKQAVFLRNFPRSTHEGMQPAKPYERVYGWRVKPPGKLHYELSRDVTWADIKSCMGELFFNGGTLDDFVAGSKDGDTFAPLDRCEGGFMCVSGPGFQSDECARLVGKVSHCKSLNGPWVRKAIRFSFAGGGQDRKTWHHVFRDNCKDDTVLLAMGETLILGFEGKGCKAWTKRECREYADIIACVLHLCPVKRSRW